MNVLGTKLYMCHSFEHRKMSRNHLNSRLPMTYMLCRSVCKLMTTTVSRLYWLYLQDLLTLPIIFFRRAFICKSINHNLPAFSLDLCRIHSEKEMSNSDMRPTYWITINLTIMVHVWKGLNLLTDKICCYQHIKLVRFNIFYEFNPLV